MPDIQIFFERVHGIVQKKRPATGESVTDRSGNSTTQINIYSEGVLHSLNWTKVQRLYPNTPGHACDKHADDDNQKTTSRDDHLRAYAREAKRTAATMQGFHAMMPGSASITGRSHGVFWPPEFCDFFGKSRTDRS
jgi:hypothetical protein